MPRKLVEGINDFKTAKPELAKEWDFEKNELGPEKYAKSSNKDVYWICSKCGYRFKAKIANRYYRNGGCPCCSNKVVVVGKNDLATTHPKLAAEWDYEKNGELTPYDITYGRSNKVWWKCPEGHSYQATILHRASGGTNCPICVSGRQTSFAEQALFYYVKKLYPDAINHYTEIFSRGMELDIYIPSIKLGIEYDGEAWHKKDKRDRERRKYRICQEHGIRLLRLKENIDDSCRDTADEFIHIDNLYQPKNLAMAIQSVLNAIDPESNMWTRTHPLNYTSQVVVNIPRDEIEIRKYMTNISGESLADKYPHIAAEWHPTMNGSVTPWKVKPMSDVKYYWLCPDCGNEYQATVGHRVSGTGCPKCAIKRNALTRCKRVCMIDKSTYEVIRVFNSISEASKQMKIFISNISSVCKGNRIAAGGYHWKYLDDTTESETIFGEK